MALISTDPKQRQGWATALAAGLIAGSLGFTAPEATAGMVPHVYEYSNLSVGTPAISGTSATIDEVFAQWDENTNQFTWSALYSADSVADLPTGFTLVVNDGPMPKGHLGELAVLYFEAEEQLAGNLLAPSTLSAYAYNGGSSASAHRTSDFADVQSLTPDAPDQIATSRNGSLNIIDSELQDFEDAGRQNRLMRIVFDATPINNHVPLQPSIDTMDDDAPLTWTGIRFAETIGIWFHPFNNINPEYFEGGPEDGFLKHGVAGATVNEGWQVVRDNYGFFDVDNLQAELVPEPASALLLLAGASMLARRRR